METRPGTSRGRVCILTSAHPAFDVRVFHKEAKTLVAAGYEVTLIAPHPETVCVSGVQIRGISPPANRWERMVVLPGRIWQAAMAEKAGVYHLQDPDLVPLGFLLKMLGKTVIYDVHEDLKEDIMTKEYIPKAIRYPLAWLSDAVEKLFSRRFDAILTATVEIARKFDRCKKVIAIKNYPRRAEFEFDSRSFQEHAEFRCVYIGGLTEVRGISQLVQAMSALGDLEHAKLTLCGKFDSEQYEQELRREDGFQRTEFLGWIDYSQVPNLLATMNVGLVCLLPVPQFVVSLPIKLFEYMAAGLPVIASNFSLWREIIESAGCGICVDPQNPLEIAAAIRYLYQRPQERRAMGERSRHAVLERFNWEEEGKKLVSVYGDLLPGLNAARNVLGHSGSGSRAL
jgi:glycosyltransferase involved in cell wall biosynthesis